MAPARILSRKALAASPETGLEHSAWFDGKFTVARKTGPGLSFDILMGEPQLATVVETAAAHKALKNQADGIDAGKAPAVIGHYCAGDAVPEWARDASQKVGRSKDGVWWATEEDARLADFVGRAARFLEKRLARLGSWSSFAEWALCETGADLTSTDGEVALAPLDYWWLGGEAGSPGVHGLPVYPASMGLLVPPEDGLIRVYSCMMKAALAEGAYSASLGRAVRSSPLPCIGCMLSGAAAILGRDVVKGALLDERWHVELAVCEEHGSEAPEHFSVFEGDAVYDIVGCTNDGGTPLWIPHGWDPSPHELTAWV